MQSLVAEILTVSSLREELSHFLFSLNCLNQHKILGPYLNIGAIVLELTSPLNGNPLPWHTSAKWIGMVNAYHY